MQEPSEEPVGQREQVGQPEQVGQREQQGAQARRPAPGRPVPVSTYRVQVRAEFGFADVAAQASYLDRLGVSHVYLSPVLAATPGSAHGYDVVDHSRLSDDAGGRAAFDAMSDVLRQHGLGAIADVVPNHVAVPTPAYLNGELWSVLRDGPASPFAHWFDVDWLTEDHALLMPVLGDRIGAVLARGDITLDRGGDPSASEPVLRYFEHVFPVRPGTESLPLHEMVDRQWYRLAHWKVADEELNYRRFFDVDTLAAVRVEDPDVFEATHRLLLDLIGQGRLDGLRIDHPDGLADPRGYLRRLAEATGGSWVVVEKILEGDETLPPDWPCAGTTGYDALMRVGGLFVDPSGAGPMTALWNRMASESRDFATAPTDLASEVEHAKRMLVAGSLYAEVHRLVELLAQVTHADVRLRDHTRRAFSDVVVELLVAFERYRAYVVPGEPAPPEQVAVLEHAVELARHRLADDRHDTLELVRDLLLGREAGSAGRLDERARAELVVRFQQTCGPVMAKGVEDTAFYRWNRLASLNEVGGNPDRFGIPTEEFHAWCERLLRQWPTSMTTLSTHDTKRAEDTRARLAVLSQVPTAWEAAVTELEAEAAPLAGRRVDAPTRYLLWQTLVATYDLGGNAPISQARLHEYLTKAVREAKVHTTWHDPDTQYEEQVLGLASAVVERDTLMSSLRAFVTSIQPTARVSVLGQKLVQLTMPGVPDVYQGTELEETSLVDPDNRRAVDYAERSERLARLDEGTAPRDLDDEKMLVTSRALRLRRERPEVFVGENATYAPLPTTTGHLVAFARGDADGASVVTLATRLPVELERLGGWGEHTVALPAGTWTDRLTGREIGSGTVAVAGVLDRYPVALLVRG